MEDTPQHRRRQDISGRRINQTNGKFTNARSERSRISDRYRFRYTFNVQSPQIRFLPFMQFNPFVKKNSHKFAFPALYHRRTIVLDGLIEVLRFSEPPSPSIVRIWIPESVIVINMRYCKNYCGVRSISFEVNSRLRRLEWHAFSSSSLQSIVIPGSVEILGCLCFSGCKSLTSISFECNSRLTRIDSEAFSFSSVQSIVIPRSVEILGSYCFFCCESLSSISFESNSELTRIDSDAFSFSSLQSILIPSNYQSIDGSAFSFMDLSNCLIESENQRFVSENCFLIDVVDHKLIRNFSSSSDVEIASNIAILGS
jgi:hypothetical protein